MLISFVLAELFRMVCIGVILFCVGLGAARIWNEIVKCL